MTESEYSIKPLSNLPNVRRLNPSKDGGGKNTKQGPDEQCLAKEERFKDDQQEDEIVKVDCPNDADGEGIDYCA